MNELNQALERMIAIQMEAYPKSWDESEAREMAIEHLFGKQKGE